ncbi:MAG: antibiotic biosynthesis monooxygenase family protein [Janthinobacterium lividum]
MILELATLHIRPGQQAGFETAFTSAERILASMEGYIDHELQQCVEADSRYRLFVHWQKVEDHTIGFRQSPRFLEWRALLQPFFAMTPDAEHYRLIAAGRCGGATSRSHEGDSHE